MLPFDDVIMFHTVIDKSVAKLVILVAYFGVYAKFGVYIKRVLDLLSYCYFTGEGGALIIKLIVKDGVAL